VFAAGVTPDDAWRVLSELPELLRAVQGGRKAVRFDPDLLRSASAPVPRTSPAKVRERARRQLAAENSPARGRVRPARR